MSLNNTVFNSGCSDQNVNILQCVIIPAETHNLQGNLNNDADTDFISTQDIQNFNDIDINEDFLENLTKEKDFIGIQDNEITDIDISNETDEPVVNENATDTSDESEQPTCNYLGLTIETPDTNLTPDLPSPCLEDVESFSKFLGLKKIEPAPELVDTPSTSFHVKPLLSSQYENITQPEGENKRISLLSSQYENITQTEGKNIKNSTSTTSGDEDDEIPCGQRDLNYYSPLRSDRSETPSPLLPSRSPSPVLPRTRTPSPCFFQNTVFTQTDIFQNCTETQTEIFQNSNETQTDIVQNCRETQTANKRDRKIKSRVNSLNFKINDFFAKYDKIPKKEVENKMVVIKSVLHELHQLVKDT